jgi:hypothetical protein
VTQGQLPTLLRLGFSTCNTPIPQHVSPLEGKTTDWRAVCGRSARTVRREGASKPIGAPYPYQQKFDGSGSHAEAPTMRLRTRAAKHTDEIPSMDVVRAYEQIGERRKDTTRDWRRILNWRCDTRQYGLAAVDGCLQAAHRSGPRSDPDAASSGPTLKAPSSAGGYLLVVHGFLELSSASRPPVRRGAAMRIKRLLAGSVVPRPAD